jgi:para-nitrobenzyl esterase
LQSGLTALEVDLMNTRYRAILAAFITILLLTGAKCAIVVSSGGGSDSHRKDDNTVVIVAGGTGQFIDGPVEGLRYESGILSGTTGRQGEFQYEQDQPVRFYIGDILLGEASRGKPVITPLDLVENGTIDTPAVINIARLLQSLDSIPGDGAITIPTAFAGPAVRTSVILAAPIEQLNFHDEAGFVNTASQIIATLTAGYPFTAVLVDAETARRHLSASLATADVPH